MELGGRRRAGGDPQPRADRRPAGGREHGQGAGRGDPQAAGRGRSPARPRRGELPRARAARAAVPVPGRERRPHAAGRGSLARWLRDRWARRSTTPPARRWTRVQGSWDSGIRVGPAIERLAADGRPRGVRAAQGDPLRRSAWTSRSRGVKTALLYATRDLGPEETERRKADLAASYQAAIVEQLASRLERALDERRLDGGGARRRRRGQRAAARAGRRDLRGARACG